MKRYTLRYGEGTVSFELNDKQVMGELRGGFTAPCADIPAALKAALNAPIDSPPLHALMKPGMKIALVVSDFSRFWMRQDLVIPHVVDYLNACGIPDRDITIIIANGTHAGGDTNELQTLVTPQIYARVRVINHDCQAPDLTYMGTTAHGNRVFVNRVAAQSDYVICLGAATHHVMAGFGGGRKSILPGISGMQTICYNHAFALDPQALRSNPLIGNARLSGNPLHEDMCEAAALMPHLFMINLVMNAEMKLSSIFAGHYLTSWQAACREVDRIYRVGVAEKADVIIASCGGFPKDMSLYQGTKTIDNIEPGLKIGGTLILLIEARDGGGPAEYFDWCQDYVNGTMEKRLREHFTVPGYIFLLNCEQARRYRVMLLTSIKQATVAPMGIEAYSDIDALLAAADLSDKRIYVIENGSTVIPFVEGAEI